MTIKSNTSVPASSDVIAIYNSSFQQLFVGAVPMALQPKRTAKVMEHPVEDGSVISDHKVINPDELDMIVYLDPAKARDLYGQLVEAFNSDDLLTIQTRVETFDNMVMMEMPHEEDSATPDLIKLTLKFKEVKFVTPETTSIPPGSASNSKDSSTKKGGVKSGKGTGAGSAGKASSQASTNKSPPPPQKRTSTLGGWL